MKYFRLKKKKDFTKILKSGKRVFSGTLTIVYLPSNRLKMAVCVGKKHGKSVKRNRIKRLLRESFRAETQESNLSYSFLLIPKVNEKYSYSVFRRDIGKILEREHLIET